MFCNISEINFLYIHITKVRMCSHIEWNHHFYTTLYNLVRRIFWNHYILGVLLHDFKSGLTAPASKSVMALDIETVDCLKTQPKIRSFYTVLWSISSASYLDQVVLTISKTSAHSNLYSLTPVKQHGNLITTLGYIKRKFRILVAKMKRMSKLALCMPHRKLITISTDIMRWPNLASPKDMVSVKDRSW